MFDKYLNKKVRVLVSTKSGAGMSNGGSLMASVLNPIITVDGILKFVSDTFIEIENSRMYYYNGACEMETPGFVKGKMNGPDVFENECTLLNIDNVISISLIREK